MKRSRRLAVTLVSLVVVTTVFTSLFIQIDSYSYEIWKYETDVGPSTFVMISSTFVPSVEDVEEVEGVDKAEDFVKAIGMMVAYPVEQINDSIVPPRDSSGHEDCVASLGPSGGDSFWTRVKAIKIDHGFFNEFPTIFNLTTGHWPEVDTEIALSSWVAHRFKVDTGDVAIYLRGSDPEYHMLYISGIYDRPEIDNRNRWYYEIGDVVVQPEYLGDVDVEQHMYVDVDQSSFSPLFAQEAISALTEIVEDLRNLDPVYSTQLHTRFLLDDLLSKGIQRYIEWLDGTRITQIARSQTSLFLVIILSAITMQFNLNHHKEELEIYYARGASVRQITKKIFRDVLSVSIAAFSLSILTGILLSRIGLSSTGFLLIDISRLFNSPFLVKFESLILSAVISITLPVLFTAVFLGLPMMKQIQPMEKGRLARFMGAVKMLRWDLVITGLSLVTLLVLWEVGTIISQFPVFSSIAVFLPIIFVAGVANLFGKGIRYLVNRFGNSIGMNLTISLSWKRFGTNSKHLGQTLLIMALGISLVWNITLVVETHPNTSLGHTRFAISGDLTLKLDPDYLESIDSFREDITGVDSVLDTALLNVFALSMSSSLLDTVPFISLSPEEFSKVGYDSYGIPLSDSELFEAMEGLIDQPSGAVVTSDISRSFAVESGDTLRAFMENDSEIETKRFTVTNVVDALPDNYVNGFGFQPPQSDSVKVGKTRIWINQEYAESVLGSCISAVYLCIRLSEGAEIEGVLESVLSLTHSDLIKGYSAAKEYQTESKSDPQFTFNQSLDTTISLLVIMTIPIAVYLYLTNTNPDRKEFDTLLKVCGLDKSICTSIHFAEIIIINLLAIILLVMTSPILIQNTIYLIVMTSSKPLTSYPVPVIPLFPILPLILLVLFSIFATSVIMALKVHSLSMQSIADRSREIWTVRPSFKRGD